MATMVNGWYLDMISRVFELGETEIIELVRFNCHLTDSV